MMSEGRVMVSKDLRTIRMSKGAWSETFSADQLADKRAFYDWLSKRHNGRHAATFAYAVDGLARAAARIAEGMSPQ